MTDERKPIDRVVSFEFESGPIDAVLGVLAAIGRALFSLVCWVLTRLALFILIGLAFVAVLFWLADKAGVSTEPRRDCYAHETIGGEQVCIARVVTE